MRWAKAEAAWTEMAEVVGRCNGIITASSLTIIREEVMILYTFFLL